MWCKFCSIETEESVCPVCGNNTDEFIPIEVYWCKNCNVPVILNVNSLKFCHCCGEKVEYKAKDLRPVFPEEKLLLELILGKEPNTFSDSSVWANGSRYYINGKVKNISRSLYSELDTKKLKSEFDNNISSIDYAPFNKYVEHFIKVNKERFIDIENEASVFIKETASRFEEENVILSFSGGKDSTVTADLVTKALSNPSLVHIFGNTTLEFPATIEYVERFRKNHPFAIFQVAKNDEQNFLDVAEIIGPPARMLRWCCSMFKTGPITRVLNSLYRNQQVLTFYGVRKVESVARSKYNRIEDNSESIKINKQTVASPIFFWMDIDIWLYILTTGIDFNNAYRFGYERVGCWLCPNNNIRDVFLSNIFLSEKSSEWRDFLLRFAKKIGKPDPEEYIDSGSWKARQGGNGLQASSLVKIRFKNCTTEEHAKIYQLFRPFDDEFLGMFVPFGKLAPELGRKLLNEIIVLDPRGNVPVLSIQPFNGGEFDYGVKIKTLNVSDHEEFQRKVGYQIRKFNACHRCLKCESVCKSGAISLSTGSYVINPQKCSHCGMCINQKILSGGCLMDKYLRTKD